MTTSTIRPGFLVACKTSVTGAITYLREDVEPEHVDADGRLVHVWDTRKVVTDAEQHDRATKVREKARSLIRSACIDSVGFGLLCPKANEAKLNEAVAEATKLAKEFNASSTLYRVKVKVLRGVVANDDAEAIKGIGSEISELLDGMQTGIANFNPKAIREAADRAKALAGMLQPGVADKVWEAVDAARASARDIAKAERDGKIPGEVAAEAAGTAMVSIVAARGYFDLDDEPAPQVAQTTAAAFELDLGDTDVMGA